MMISDAAWEKNYLKNTKSRKLIVQTLPSGKKHELQSSRSRLRLDE